MNDDTNSKPQDPQEITHANKKYEEEKSEEV